MAKKPVKDDSICRNRKAGFRFEFIEKYECGIVLCGTEVKSLRAGDVSLDEAYARMEGGEVWLIGCHIAPYAHGSTRPHHVLSRRKLLLHRHQIAKIRPKIEQRGLTFVPVRMYFNERGIAKITIALARGKTMGDKRQTLKSKQAKRDMDRAMRRGR